MFKNFESAILYAQNQFTDEVVHAQKWQGIDISKKPEMAMHEVLNFSFEVPMYSEKIEMYQQDIKPNLPWADIHFEEERVSGQPINPGRSWKIWPYGHSASKFLDPKGQFNHTYAERYWPKYAGSTPDGIIYNQETLLEYIQENESPNYGIREQYGDLSDIIRILKEDPESRQAYLPVWFPEDLSHKGRKPCSLGYHFIMRNKQLHIIYYIRSCDFVRHFRDDIYLTIRLALWVLEKLRGQDPVWNEVKPGNFLMHITSLHMFRNDYLKLKGV